MYFDSDPGNSLHLRPYVPTYRTQYPFQEELEQRKETSGVYAP